MQLGITIPLQKYLKVKQPPYGEPIDLFFCWELHVIRFMGKKSIGYGQCKQSVLCDARGNENSGLESAARKGRRSHRGRSAQ